MDELRLNWEPENKTPLHQIEDRFKLYMKGKGGVTILKNSTLLFLTEGKNDEDDARKAMDEARFLTDFKVVELKEGGYLIGFHDAVAVFVSVDEFAAVKEEVTQRMKELTFPGEKFFNVDTAGDDNILIGLYARGKLQRDAYNFGYYKRIFG